MFCSSAALATFQVLNTHIYYRTFSSSEEVVPDTYALGCDIYMLMTESEEMRWGHGWLGEK